MSQRWVGGLDRTGLASRVCKAEVFFREADLVGQEVSPQPEGIAVAGAPWKGEGREKAGTSCSQGIIVLGWPKSLFGFSHKMVCKNPNILANPIFYPLSFFIRRYILGLWSSVAPALTSILTAGGAMWTPRSTLTPGEPAQVTQPSSANVLPSLISRGSCCFSASALCQALVLRASQAGSKCISSHFISSQPVGNGLGEVNFAKGRVGIRFSNVRVHSSLLYLPKQKIGGGGGYKDGGFCPQEVTGH